MPDAIITSTASTFGTITGTFAADQSTVTGTVTGIITGTLTGSVGVPGPQGEQGIQGDQGIQGVPGDPGAPGVGVPAAGTTGQVLQKLSATSYDTGWLTLPASYISSVTAPLDVTTGNLTIDLSAYLPVAGGTLDANAIIDASTATQASLFSGTGLNALLTSNPSENVTVNYSGVRVENDIGEMLVGPYGLTFPNSSVQTVAYPGDSGFLLKVGNLSGLADTAVSRTNLGLGSLAVINDAPSDGSQYARRNAAWEAVAASGASVTISATAPVSPSSGDLWLRTTDYRTFTWTGAEWVESSAGYVSEIGSTFETVSKNLNAYPATLAYSIGLLTSITYALGGGLTIVKTFNYTGADLTSIVLSGYTPGGISLTKTLTYSAGELVGITYS